jgi:hypothetical protein
MHAIALDAEEDCDFMKPASRPDAGMAGGCVA